MYKKPQPPQGQPYAGSDYDDLVSLIVPSGTAQASVIGIMAETKRYHKFTFPHLYKFANSWATTEPDLTTPDLEDSVEAMFARAQAGIINAFDNQQQGVRSIMMSPLPVDPTSTQTAKGMLAELKNVAETKLKAAEANLAAETKKQAKLRADKQADAIQFEEYKKRQAEIKQGK